MKRTNLSDVGRQTFDSIATDSRPSCPPPTSARRSNKLSREAFSPISAKELLSLKTPPSPKKERFTSAQYIGGPWTLAAALDDTSARLLATARRQQNSSGCSERLNKPPSAQWGPLAPSKHARSAITQPLLSQPLLSPGRFHCSRSDPTHATLHSLILRRPQSGYCRSRVVFANTDTSHDQQ